MIRRDAASDYLIATGKCGALVRATQFQMGSARPSGRGSVCAHVVDELVGVGSVGDSHSVAASSLDVLGWRWPLLVFGGGRRPGIGISSTSGRLGQARRPGSH